MAFRITENVPPDHVPNQPKPHVQNYSQYHHTHSHQHDGCKKVAEKNQQINGLMLIRSEVLHYCVQRSRCQIFTFSSFAQATTTVRWYNLFRNAELFDRRAFVIQLPLVFFSNPLFSSATNFKNQVVFLILLRSDDALLRVTYIGMIVQYPHQ